MADPGDRNITTDHVTQDDHGRWTGETVPDDVVVHPAEATGGGDTAGAGAAGGTGGAGGRQWYAVATHPLIVAATTGLLLLAAAVGLAMRWGGAELSLGQVGDAEAVMRTDVSGFGVIRGTFTAANSGETWVDAWLLSVATGLILLVLVSAAFVAFTPVRRIGALLTVLGGAGFIGYAVYGLVTTLGVEQPIVGDGEVPPGGDEMFAQILEMVQTSQGPGAYVVLVAGVLLVVVGGFFMLRTAEPWLPVNAGADDVAAPGENAGSGFDGGAGDSGDALPDSAGSEPRN